MRVPYRKPGKYANIKTDLNITIPKFNEFKKEVKKLKKYSKPKAIKETQRLAEMGDFSENFAYQDSKRKLRGINRRIDEIDFILNRAIIIEPNKNSDKVQLGNFVTVEVNGKQQIYQVLGSEESDPSKGIISHNSPIGSAIINKKIGDVMSIQMRDRVIKCIIIQIK